MTTSIRTRFAASLMGNMLRSAIAFATGLLLARWLGPQDYGRMAFLLASFVAFRQFLDMGSSTAFFTLLSQRQRSQRFISIFWAWVSLQFIVSVLAVWLLLPDEFVHWAWVGESRRTLLLALFASFMQGTVWTIASQMAEASRETVRVQKLNTLIVFLHLTIVLTLWHFQKLAIPLVFTTLAIEWGLAGWVAARLYRAKKSIQETLPLQQDTVRSVWLEFRSYCLPLVPYAWLGFVHDFADRWMLQHWGGSTEQAYFSVAQQFATVALLATSSILSIFWKEIAEAHHNGDTERVAHLYKKISRTLFFTGAAMAGGLIPWAQDILRLTVGQAYASGGAILMLMFLYPAHQSLGQIGGTMLYATGHVRTQVMLGLASMSISLLLAYFMMAPTDALIPGLGLASRGLGVKMVLLQMLQVNVVAWFIARLFGWKFDWQFQVVGLLCCAALGGVSYLAVTLCLPDIPTVIQMAVAGMIYVAMLMLLLFMQPWLAGLSQSELSAYRAKLLGARIG